ncbi:MAG: PTS sugar transporter subunit IIA [Deltaproteobacteria bacterium]|jgi:PTS system mannose-specific IIA component|nr:PTS sugar transporter subunit IIA [Deltaproteobacteria bacterium]
MPTNNTNNNSVGLAVVTHVDYGASLLRAAEHIVGPIQDCVSIQVDINNDVQETLKRLNDAVALLDSGAGVLVLTDMFGGTPTNLSLSLLGRGGNIEVLTGVNLPMLLKVLSNRQKPLEEISELACEAGREGIAVAGDILRSKIKKSDDQP